MAAETAADQTWPAPGTKDKSVVWYEKELKGLSDTTRHVLETYARIPPDQVVEHVHAIREKAWDVFPYPCIGGWRFLDLSIGQAAQYEEILKRVKDIRKLVTDGAPSNNLYGTDLNAPFFDLGYDLFRDRSTLQAHLFASDIFKYDPNSTSGTHPLAPLTDTVSIIHASSFFHLFDRPDQVQLACLCVALLIKQPGSLVFGRQTGNYNPGVITGHPAHGGHTGPIQDPATNQLGKTSEAVGNRADGHGEVFPTPGPKKHEQVFHHNDETFKEMWREVGEKTGTRWKVEVEMTKHETWGSMDVPGMFCRLKYACWML
ncbi:MAG: hypothetical protein M1828_002430 [Chrysothrix sp. TS-e1954]|nr:MAG: hypothetical protein M1828_002430 [Chrysothrix sp. TS-e1954]